LGKKNKQEKVIINNEEDLSKYREEIDGVENGNVKQ
jgi:hypothetical protein